MRLYRISMTILTVLLWSGYSLACLGKEGFASG